MNVRELRFTEDPEADLEFVVRPDFRRLGPRLGRRMQRSRAAIAALSGREAKARLEDDGHLTLALPDDGAPLRLEAADLRIETRPREGRAVAGTPLATVALDTRLGPELRREGRYRELLNRVQTWRKDLDLPYTARIRLALEGAEDADSLLAVAREREAHFLRETLAVELRPGPLPGGERREIEIEGERAALFLEVVPAPTPSGP